MVAWRRNSYPFLPPPPPPPPARASSTLKNKEDALEAKREADFYLIFTQPENVEIRKTNYAVIKGGKIVYHINSKIRKQVENLTAINLSCNTLPTANLTGLRKLTKSQKRKRFFVMS